MGLQDLDAGWAGLLGGGEAGGSSDGEEHRLFEPEDLTGQRPLLILVQGLEEANNVAFSECLLMAREQNLSLWYVGELKPVYRRFFDRCFSGVGALAEVLAEAQTASTGRVEVLLNPEMILVCYGKDRERAVLRALQEALAGNREQVTGRPEVAATLFWNSRNAAYLLRCLEGGGASRSKPDLILQVGPEPGFHGSVHQEPAATAESVKTICWGWRENGADLFIPLDRSSWLSGYSEPSGRRPRRSGKPSQEAFKSFIIG